MSSLPAIALSRETSDSASVAPPWLPTDAWVRILLVPVLAFMALASNTAYLADFWHHLARGQVMVAEGRLLNRDIYTFTVPGQPFQDVNWLSQIAYAGLFNEGGLALVRTVNALVMALAMGMLVGLCHRLSGSLVGAMMVGIAVFLGLWHVITIRPQTFSLVLFVLLFDVLERCRRRPGLLLLPPVLLALWVNLHGAFPAGLMLVGSFLAGEVFLAWQQGRLWNERRVWQLAACLIACTLATLVNPYGWHIYHYVGLTSNRAAARGIDEWAPPRWDEATGVAFFLSLCILAVLIGASYFRGRGINPTAKKDRTIHWPTQVALVLCFLPLAAGSVRMAAWWFLAMAPLAAILWAQLMPSSTAAENKPSLGAGLTCVVLVLLAIFSVPGLQAFNPLLAFRPQEKIEDELEAVLGELNKDKSQGRIFTRFEWGEYLAWAAHPNFSVFMDGRIEIFPDKVWNEYEAVTTGQDWEKILDAYEVNTLILDRDYHERTGLLAKVKQSSFWLPMIEGKNAILFVRK